MPVLCLFLSPDTLSVPRWSPQIPRRDLGNSIKHRQEEEGCLGKEGLSHSKKRTLSLCPVLSCPGKLGDLRCRISVTSACQSQRPLECGRFPIRHSSRRIKAVSLIVSSQTDSLFRAVIQKLRLLKTYLIRPECSVMWRSSIQRWLCCHIKMQKFL